MEYKCFLLPGTLEYACFRFFFICLYFNINLLVPLALLLQQQLMKSQLYFNSKSLSYAILGSSSRYTMFYSSLRPIHLYRSRLCSPCSLRPPFAFKPYHDTISYTTVISNHPASSNPFSKSVSSTLFKFKNFTYVIINPRELWDFDDLSNSISCFIDISKKYMVFVKVRHSADSFAMCGSQFYCDLSYGVVNLLFKVGLLKFMIVIH